MYSAMKDKNLFTYSYIWRRDLSSSGEGTFVAGRSQMLEAVFSSKEKSSHWSFYQIIEKNTYVCETSKTQNKLSCVAKQN